MPEMKRCDMRRKRRFSFIQIHKIHRIRQKQHDFGIFRYVALDARSNVSLCLPHVGAIDNHCRHSHAISISFIYYYFHSFQFNFASMCFAVGCNKLMNERKKTATDGRKVDVIRVCMVLSPNQVWNDGNVDGERWRLVSIQFLCVCVCQRRHLNIYKIVRYFRIF